MKKIRNINHIRLIPLILAVVIIISFASSAITAAAGSFSDVPSNAWYSKYLSPLVSLEIVTGYGDNTFRPSARVTRAEFLKMLAVGSELFTMDLSSTVHWAQVYYRMASEAEILYVREGEKNNLLFPCTADALNAYISRSEMALLIANTMSVSRFEARCAVASPAATIKDYSSIPDKYKDSVEQAFGKGVLTGYDDGTFRGSDTLTRAEACTVIYRLLWSKERVPASFATLPEKPIVEPPKNFVSFASRYASMSDAERRIALFGDPAKTYFTSSNDAANFMASVTVPAWKMDNGKKVSGTITLTVHKLVAEEVKLIFTDIYNSSEQFPMISWGGARFSDTLRHAWGCAIDINANENFYCQRINGVTQGITGSFWKPYESPYSITPDGSVVKAFAKYGWGWGGQGWSGGYYDYMHFSILSSGG